MFGRDRIADLIPHGGAMCLLDQVVRWDERDVACLSRTHLDGWNPLRRNGRLGTACGIEYGLQAAALHGALRDGARQKPGYLAALREVVLRADRLDDPAHGTLSVSARLELGEAAGLIYTFSVASEAGACLVAGRATIMFSAD